jgi:hypothetical protein
MPRKIEGRQKRFASRTAPTDIECDESCDAGAKIQSRLPVKVFTTNGKGRVRYLPDPPGFWGTTTAPSRPLQEERRNKRRKSESKNVSPANEKKFFLQEIFHPIDPAISKIKTE